MKNKLKNLTNLINKYAKDEGINSTKIPGVSFLRYTNSIKKSSKVRWPNCIGIIVQGEKKISLGEVHHKLQCGSYTITPVDLPIDSRISKASKEAPFLGLIIDLNSLILKEVITQLSTFSPQMQTNESISTRAIFYGAVNTEILESSLRLVKLLDNKEASLIVGPLIIREIYYHFLSGQNGTNIKNFFLSGNKINKIIQVINKIKLCLCEEINVTILANEVNMSRSSFFQHFKEITAMSPIQYQKKMRLLEARRLMIQEEETAESSSYKVGYKSPSQFSREYSRMFGSSPKKDTHLQIT